MDYANFKITTSTKKIAAMDARINIIRGGTSASKTYSIIALLQSIAEMDAGCVITVVSESIPHLKRGAVRDFLAIMKDVGVFIPENWNKQSLTYLFFNGSTIEFITVDEDTARGSRRDYLFVNEANLISWTTFSELEIRTRKKIWIDYNPVNEFWADEELLAKRSDIAFEVLTYKDNEALDENTVKAIEARRGDGSNNWWRVYGLGQIGSLEGNIYSGWTAVEEIPSTARLVRLGCDFGFSNDPTGVVSVWEGEDNTLYLDEIIYESGLLTRDLIPRLQPYPDTVIVCDSARPEAIAEMAEAGLRAIACEKGAGSVKGGIEKVMEYKICYTKTSRNLEKEYLTYAWRKKRDGKKIDEPEDGNDHILDALRYAVRDLSRKVVEYGGVR